MSSSALSSRRRYLRRPKVCKTLPNPGRCEPPLFYPMPCICPPPVILGFFDFSGLPDCHGPDHRRIFTALYQFDTEDPWVYISQDPPFPNTDGIHLELSKTPLPTLFANTWYIGAGPAHCAYALRNAFPVTWCVHQSLDITQWDDVTSGLSCNLFVGW